MNANNLARWILLITLASGFYSVGAVWLAQLNWELWVYVGRAEFETYHLAWWHGIWWAIFPIAAVALVGSFAELKWRPFGVPAWAAWLGVIIQVVTYFLTAIWWGPGQALLTQTHLENRFDWPLLLSTRHNQLAACGVDYIFWIIAIMDGRKGIQQQGFGSEQFETGAPKSWMNTTHEETANDAVHSGRNVPRY